MGSKQLTFGPNPHPIIHESLAAAQTIGLSKVHARYNRLLYQIIRSCVSTHAMGQKDALEDLLKAMKPLRPAARDTPYNEGFCDALDTIINLATKRADDPNNREDLIPNNPG